MKKKKPQAPPLVISLCGTWLKAEMQSLYRQVAHLQKWRTIVYTERVQNTEQFPFPDVIKMTQIKRPRLAGNFILRFWYKHIIKKWPLPKPINKLKKPYYPYNLIDLLKQDMPTLIHVYYGHKAVKYRQMLEAWGGPFLVSFHGVDVVKFTDDPNYCAELKKVFSSAKLILARSHSLLERLEILGCPKEKLRLNHTPIPFEGITPEIKHAPDDGQWKLLQACRLIPKKGLFTLLSALEIVIKKYPQLHYTLCGNGPLTEELQKEIENKSLTENVRLAGWQTPEQLKQHYQNAHAFLHPSELTETNDQEGIPNSMLEAMAHGLPIIATTHGGIPEAVTNGKEGFLVPEKSPAALASAIIALLDNPSLLEKFSQQAALSVREKFGLPQQIENLEDCYDEAVQAVQVA